ncbi:hypothetical protein G9A89_010372 [Geosiphon pyriformis]|nr:hypothetical protein G9A89_010372 [Geosiphon pyriformis]
MTTSLAREKGINVNSNLKRQGMRSNQTWSFLIGKDSVCVAKTVENCETWASRDQFKALLFTLPVRTTIYDLGNLLERTGRKTCIINRSIEIGNRICCTVVSFVSDDDLESAFHMEPIFNGMKLSWTRMDLVCYEKCGHFRHSALECNTPDAIMLPSSKGSYKKGALEKLHFWLAKLYEKKCVPISCSAAFGGKSWAQVVSLSKSSGSVHSGFGPSLSFYGLLGLGGISSPVFTVSSGLSNYLVVLERSLELLADQVSNIMKKLSFVELVPLASKSSVSPLIIPAPLNSVVNSDMAINNMLASPVLPFLVVADTVADLSSSSSKVLTTKMGGLESKLVALEVFSGLKVFNSGMNSGHCGLGVAIVLNDEFTYHVCKISEVSERLISVYLLFAGKASVMILGLYTGASAGVRFKQASVVNALIALAISFSSYILLGGDFNENGAKRSVNFKKCSDLGLHNVLLAEVKKTINFIFVSNYLSSAVFGECVGRVSDYFDTDYLAVSISVGLGGLLDKQLNTLHKLANTDHWKFNFKDSDTAKWKCFDNCTTVDMLLLKDNFTAAKNLGDLNAMWELLEKVLTKSVDSIFSKYWYSIFDCFRNKHLSRFYRLELLIAKIVKALSVGDSLRFVCLAKIWSVLDDVESSKISGLLDACSNSVEVFKQLSVVKKHYHKVKYIESELVKNVSINRAISKHMDDFVLRKGNMISSILECFFYKVVLDHLVLDGDLILELAEVKTKVDNIMVDWTKKHKVLESVPDLWSHQYAFLDYVVDNTFSGVMNEIRLGDLCAVVKNLPDSKAAGLLGVSNELWKHNSDLVLSCFLDLLNSCLVYGNVLALGDNFSVLKGTSTQLPVFIIGSIIEDALKKNFGLSDGYKVLDGLDQGRVELQTEMTSFFVAGAFVDNTIWVGSSQAAIQCILDVVQSENKLSSVINFANAPGILRQLFIHWSLNLQVASWLSVHLLCHSIKLQVNPRDNFLAGMWLNLHGPVLVWFDLAIHFLGACLLAADVRPCMSVDHPVSFIVTNAISEAQTILLDSGLVSFDVFTNGSVKHFGSCFVVTGAAAFFSKLGLGVAIAFALTCVPSSSSVFIYSDSQVAFFVCLDKLLLALKGYSGVLGNEHADEITSDVCWCDTLFLTYVNKFFLKLGDLVLSCNENKFGSKISDTCKINSVDWKKTFAVWHPDGHMAFGYTSYQSAALRSYFMKSLYGCLLIAVRPIFWCGNAEFYSMLVKGFVPSGWYHKALDALSCSVVAGVMVINFVKDLALLHKSVIWCGRSNH